MSRIAAGESEAQEYTMDELGSLMEFEQGLFTNGTLDTGALSAPHQWRLDELGNWREHRGDPADSFLTPSLDLVNAYTNRPAPFDDDGDGAPDVLTRTHDGVRGFLYYRGEIGGGESTYIHDPFGRLSRVQRDIPELCAWTCCEAVPAGTRQSAQGWRQEGGRRHRGRC